MQRVRRIISIFLLAAISLYIAPRNVLHALAGHEHTVDVVCTDAVHHVGEPHHHCDCLQLSSPPLYHSLHSFSFACSLQPSLEPEGNFSAYHFSLSPFLFFRGPPLVS